MRSWPVLLAANGLGGPDIRLWLMLGPAGHTLVHLRITASLLLLLLTRGPGVARRGRPGRP